MGYSEPLGAMPEPTVAAAKPLLQEEAPSRANGGKHLALFSLILGFGIGVVVYRGRSLDTPVAFEQDPVEEPATDMAFAPRSSLISRGPRQSASMQQGLGQCMRKGQAAAKGMPNRRSSSVRTAALGKDEPVVVI